MKIKVIITGSTGMVGEGVLHECLLHPDIDKVLVINRRPCGVAHPKLSEIIHDNFFDLSQIESQLSGYYACFYCLGVTSLGLGEDEYSKITYTLTMNVAKTLVKLNPGMTFCYISGAGTETPERAKFMWARVKGKTEIDLMKMPFKRTYMLRPGFMNPTKGLHNVPKYYYVFSLLYPFFRLIMPNFVSTLKELGLAMINLAARGYEKQILEVPDIIRVSKL